MGVIRHHAMIVTGYDMEDMKATRRFAELCNLDPSPIMESHSNGYLTFFIPPDGSKEGWERSQEGDEERDRFKKFLRKRRVEDWVELAYGGDMEVPIIEDDYSKNGD